MKVECQECGKNFHTDSMLPRCPKCGGSDIDIQYPTSAEHDGVYMRFFLFLFFIIMLSMTASSQTVTTWKGTVIPVKAVAGADVTIAPIDHQFTHVGWIQVNITVWPVYSGSRGGLFTYRENKAGVKTKYYLTDEQKAKMTRE